VSAPVAASPRPRPLERRVSRLVARPEPTDTLIIRVEHATLMAVSHEDLSCICCVFFSMLAAAVTLTLASGQSWAQATSGRYAVVARDGGSPLAANPDRTTLYSCSPSTMTHLLTEERFRYLARVAVHEIEQLLATEGYFSPRVDYRIEEDPKTLTAQLSVIPGAPTTVASFTLEFSGAILRDNRENRLLRDELLKSWPLQQGTVLAKCGLGKREGGPDPRLGMRIGSQPPASRIAAPTSIRRQQTASLRVELDSGPEFTFGELEISGLEHFPPSVHHLRITRSVREHRIANAHSQTSRRTLQSTGYFTSVFVSISPEPERAQRAHDSRASRREHAQAPECRRRVQHRQRIRRSRSLRWYGAGHPRLACRAQRSSSRKSNSRCKAKCRLPTLIRNTSLKIGARLKHEDLEGQTTMSTVLGARLVRTTRGYRSSLFPRRSTPIARKSSNGLITSSRCPLNVVRDASQSRRLALSANAAIR